MSGPRGLGRGASGPRAHPAVRRALLLATLLLGSVPLLGCSPSGNAVETSQPDAWVEIKGQRVAADLALTPAEQSLGLGRRDSLPWNHGMLFLYERPGFYRFWMKEMRFDIDIVFIRDGRIVDIAHAVPHVPGENGPTVTPRELTDTVLEVPSGYAQTHRWRVGHRVQIERKNGGDGPDPTPPAAR